MRPLPIDDEIPAAVADDPDPEVAMAARISLWLDDHYLDPVIGFFFPGVGDLFTSGAGLYVVSVAMKKKLPPVVIARMLLNLTADAAVGAIPVLGDLFDVAFKANKRNLRLLQVRHETRRASMGDWAVVVGAALLFLGALALPVVVAIKLLTWLF